MKHIVIVNHNAGSIYHGPNFRSYYVGRSLVKGGLKVTIVCSSFSHKLTSPPEVDGDFREDVVDGVRILWLKMPVYKSSIGRLWSYIQFAMRLRHLGRLVPEKVDAVICSSPPPFWIWACSRFARSRCIPLIFECRDLWPDVILETRRAAFLNPVIWIMQVAERAAYRKSDQVVAVNPQAIQKMQERGLEARKFYCIPNGVSLSGSEEDVPLDTSLSELMPRQPGFRVVYAGSLSNVYGLKFLLKAAELLEGKGIQFVLAGSGPDEPELREQGYHLSNVTFVGWVPKTQLLAFLREADVAYAGLLDIPSFTLGSDSTKVFEYMKASLPVVHAIGGQYSPVAEGGAGCQVAPECPEAIVKALLKLQSLSPEQRDLIGASGKAYIERDRSYEVLGRKWIQLLGQ